MNDHDGCEPCQRFNEAWHSALSDLWQTVARLRDASRTGDALTQTHGEAEFARLNAENARTMLELHRSGRA